MKRTLVFLASVACGSFLAADADAQGVAFDFTVSASATDPYVNAGPVTGAQRTLYLWFVCPQLPDHDLMALAVGFAVPDGSANLGFSTAGYPTLNTGDETNLLMAVAGCPTDRLVLGEWTVLDVVPGGYCLVPDDLGRALVASGCDCLGCWGEYPLDQIGYAAGGVSDCPLTDGFFCTPTTATDRGSWGQLKGLYR